MNDLLETVLAAHGGLDRWNQLTTVSARLVQSGALWALKGQPEVVDDVVVTASLHQERASHRPCGKLPKTVLGTLLLTYLLGAADGEVKAAG